MERKPIVLLDCDGVLADFVKSYLTWLNASAYARPGEPYRQDEVHEFDIGKALGLPDNMWVEFSAWLNADETRLQFDVLGSSTVEAVRLLKQNCDVLCLTSPLSDCDLWVARRNTWLKQHFSIKKDDIFHGSRKELVRGDFLVDDRLDNILRWAEANPLSRGLLFDQPWNRNTGMLPQNVKRVYDWSEVIRAVQET